jgi:hypothetical protein
MEIYRIEVKSTMVPEQGCNGTSAGMITIVKLGPENKEQASVNTPL